MKPPSHSAVFEPWSQLPAVTDLLPTSTLPTSTLPVARRLNGGDRLAAQPSADSDSLQPIAAQVLRHVGQAVLVVDPVLNVRFANNAAADLLVDNAVLKIVDGSLGCFDTTNEQRLVQAIAGLKWADPVAGAQSQTLRMQNSRRGVTLLLTVRRYIEEPAAGCAHLQPVYLLVLHQLSRQRRICTTMLKQAFDLTGAEASIAALLAQGYESCQIAAIREVSVETVRAQLRNVFTKTGANRQADVVRLVIELSALAPEPE